MFTSSRTMTDSRVFLYSQSADALVRSGRVSYKLSYSHGVVVFAALSREEMADANETMSRMWTR